MVKVALRITSLWTKTVRYMSSEWIAFLILLIAAVLRFWHLGYPTEKYFDEVYHVPAIQRMSLGDLTTVFEWWHPSVDGQNYFDWLHPPFAKYLQALSVWIGRAIFHSESSFWWRFPSALFGLSTVWLVMAVVRRLGSQTLLAHRSSTALAPSIVRYSAAFAGLVVAVDGLLIVQSRIAMNDAILGCLLTLVVWLVTRSVSIHRASVRNIWLASVVVGLALATKWTAVFMWLVLVGWLGVVLMKSFIAHQGKGAVLLASKLLLTLIVPVLVYVLAYAPAAITHQGYAHVFQLHREVWLYHFNRDHNHRYASQPIQWLLNIRPVWYWQDKELSLNKQTEKKTVWQANIYAMSHPLLPLLTIVVVCGIVWQLLVMRSRLKVFWHVLFITVLYMAVWMPWIVSPRIMFFYHYLPAIPLIAVLTGVWLQSLVFRRKTLLHILFLSGAGIWIWVAILWLPHWLGLRVPKELVDTIYFGLPGWR